LPKNDHQEIKAKGYSCIDCDINYQYKAMKYPYSDLE